jgi:hypothetical protein
MALNYLERAALCLSELAAALRMKQRFEFIGRFREALRPKPANTSSPLHHFTNFGCSCSFEPFNSVWSKASHLTIPKHSGQEAIAWDLQLER